MPCAPSRPPPVCTASVRQQKSCMSPMARSADNSEPWRSIWASPCSPGKVAALNSQMRVCACAMSAASCLPACAAPVPSCSRARPMHPSSWPVRAACWRAGLSRAWTGSTASCRHRACSWPPAKASWTPGAPGGTPLLHPSSRPQAGPSWASGNALDSGALRYGQGFEHLYYLLEAAAAGLGVAIAPQQLVADDLAAGRLVAPWGFVETAARLVLWRPLRSRDNRAERLAQWLASELGEPHNSHTP